MATENYGLPTFDGENATKPIQFKSTITQGFQKIDEVMKENENAAAPVGDLVNTINELNNKVNSLSKIVYDMNNQTRNRPSFKTISDSSLFLGDIRFGGLCNDGIYINYEIYAVTAEGVTIPANTVVAEADGNVFNLTDNMVFERNIFGERIDSSSYSVTRSINSFRMTISYDSVQDKTVVKITTKVEGSSGNFWVISGTINARNNITQNERPVTPSTTDEPPIDDYYLPPIDINLS